MSEFQSGAVKWYNKDKGYGFIKIPNDALDVFIHANQLRKSGIDQALAEGQKVQFKLSKGQKGSFATDISLVD